MKTEISYRKMQRGEESRVFELVKSGFDETVLPDVTEEGAKEFFRAAREMIYDQPSTHFILVADLEGAISGMTDVRDNNHICLFFVEKTARRKRIGRNLMERAIEQCISENTGVSAIEVNSSLFAVPIYKKMGFLESRPVQLLNGIRFVSMIRPLRKQ